MRKSLIVTFIFFPALLFSQANLKEIKKESYQAFAYKITAAEVEKSILKDSIDIDAFLTEVPAAVFAADSIDEKKLAPGHYVIISIEDNRIVANLSSVSNLTVYPVNNQQRVQLLVVNREGEYIKDAKVWVNGKEAPYQIAAQSYLVKQKNPDKALIKIYTSNDTLFSSLSAKDDIYKSVAIQRWENFKKTWLIRKLAWLPEKIKNIFIKRYHYKSYYAGATGTIVFNQPKYKQTDTVKFKAYVFNRKWKEYRNPVNVFLEYYLSGKHNKILAKNLAPSSAGSFIFQFPLSDSLPADINYTILLKTSDGKNVLSRSFRVEDYVPDEIVGQNLRSAKDIYYAGDTLHFEASANNANGQSILDGTARLVLTATSINRFYKDSLYIPDTLFVQEKPLQTNGETTFDFSSLCLPPASLQMKATVEFKNSNNELQQKDIIISYRYNEKEFTAFIEKDSVVALFKQNGKITPAAGTLHIEDDWNRVLPVQYPYKTKLSSLAYNYSFYLLEDGKKMDSANVEANDHYEVLLSRISRGDTLGFILNNPGVIPVSYTVFDGDIIKGAGKSSDEHIMWTMAQPNKKHAYRVSWQYFWKGEENIREQYIALLYKLLNIEVKSSPSVFPGQQDTIAVNVRDYKNRPVKDVNLTAMSYNSQFSKDTYVPDPPYLVKYKMRPHLLRDKFEEDEGYILKKYPLGLHPAWIKKFSADSMLYYKMLFPERGMLDVATAVTDIFPQLSVHVVEKGERKEIYLLYVNRNLVYYNGVTEKMKDAYRIFPGYAQIGIRLNDRFLQIDSIYLQPYYKHDLFFDIDNLPPHTAIKALTDSLTYDETSLLERNLWQLDNNYKTNEGYVWQQEKLILLSGNRPHIAGPFREGESIGFYSPGYFDLNFLFEPGYLYNLSPQIYRLEKNKIFGDNYKKIKLPVIASAEWILGDTIPGRPVISYVKQPVKMQPFLKTHIYSDYKEIAGANGKLYFTIAKDSVLKYVVLYNTNNPASKFIEPGNQQMLNNIKPGEYSLMLVNKDWKSAVINHIVIKSNETYCIHTKGANFNKENNLLGEWVNETVHPAPAPVRVLPDTVTYSPVKGNMPAYETGKAGITGKITDHMGGLGIPYVSILVKGSSTGTNSAADGNFRINNIKPGKCTLVITALGYVSKQIAVTVPENGNATVNISLSASSQALNEVVVTGYGTSKKKDLTGSITAVRGEELSKTNLNINEALQGKVAGISITREGEADGGNNFLLRGIASVNANSKPLYIIDGIMYEEMPENISAAMIASVNILKNEEAVALYGSKGMNGVVIISTSTKKLRSQFRDYAFWQPALFTDKNGQVKFGVTWPDNITGWQTYVLGMDKKRRMGKTFSFTKSYRPLLAQVSIPQFLIEGDTAEITGKALNYSNSDYLLATNFSVNNHLLGKTETLLKSNSSALSEYILVAPAKDTLQAAFAIQSTTGFKDEEEKKIPILQKGSSEANGVFWVLDKDTTVSFTAASGSESVECFAQNNTLDILLDEINYLKKYPYYCMEQTASKLRGLLIEKNIRKKLQQRFEDEAVIPLLIAKLQKNQLYDGGWSWWENGKADLFITNYVIRSLLPVRSEGMIEANIRNGLLYLQNRLHGLNREELLAALLTMSEAGHLINYQTWLNKIDFDSLNTHQQWQLVKIMQAQNIDYSNEEKNLMKKSIGTVLGGLHWGEENYHWYSDADATTVLAFEVLQKEKNRQQELKGIIHYFLERRSGGYWNNTVASASIVAALVPYILAENKNFKQPAVLTVTGDTSFTVNQYPFKMIIPRKNAKTYTIHKTGGGLTYLTFYQQIWNKNPAPLNTYFDIHSSFQRNGQTASYLTAGQKIKMMVKIDVLKEADYVMIEIPVPAGCTYASKEQDDWSIHKEYLKNKVLIFSEKMSKGMHYFEIDLEPRYTGIYTLNPAKASLMYFPVFFGRNNMQQITIRSADATK